MRKSQHTSSYVSALGSGVVASLLAFASSGAGAQEGAAQATPGTQANLEEVVVTGTHITNGGFSTPTPVTVVGQERLEQLGITNVADALNELPSFRALVTPATQQAVGGNIGARQLDLRGLGANRTLVLLDGKRFIPSTTTGTVDINLIPSAIVKRTEVVTGGASAAYGSDAVAGVVNFILDKNFEGVKASTEYGISRRHDDKDYNLSLAFGNPFAGGHFLAAVEYDDAKGMGDCYARDWCPREQLVGNSPAGYAGLPASIRTGPDAPGNLNQDGLINTTSGPLRGITFNPNGTLRNYQYGQIFGTNLSPLFTRGGEGTYENGYLQGILLWPPVRRVTAFVHLDHAFNDHLSGNLDVSFGQVEGTVVGSEARVSNFTIRRDSAYLPAQVASIMDANNVSSFTLGRVFGDLGGSVDNSTNRTYRAVASLAGDITGSWNWDAYYQFGRNTFKQVYSGDVVTSRLLEAVDAVQAGGQIVCRVNARAVTDAACVPFNVFGRGNSSAAARAFVAPSGFQTDDTTEHVLAANVHGEPLMLPAGPLAVAAGLEYRSDDLVGGADALSAANAFWSFNGKAINGKIQVKEGYVEAVAPLLKNLPMANALELNGAVRRTSYDRSSPGLLSSTADATTWKGGIVYEPIEEVRFRATRSRDIRAPNLSELFGPVAAGRTTIVDPQNAGMQIQVNSLSGSNPRLLPEQADTWTAGVVLSPKWEFARSLKISADYFSIDLKGAIATLGAQTVVNRCTAGATEFCQFVTRDASGVLVQVQDLYQNINEQVDRGIDFEAGYTAQLGKFGSMDYRLLATHYLEYSTRDSVGVTDRVGQTGYRPGTTTGVPDWVVDGMVSWNLERWTLTAHGRYIPRGIFDTLLVGPEDPGYNPSKANSVSTNRVAGAFYLDLGASVHLGANAEVFGVIDNLLDKDPPLAASAQGGTNQVYFDPVGRYFKIGVRLKM